MKRLLTFTIAAALAAAFTNSAWSQGGQSGGGGTSAGAGTGGTAGASGTGGTAGATGTGGTADTAGTIGSPDPSGTGTGTPPSGTPRFGIPNPPQRRFPDGSGNQNDSNANARFNANAGANTQARGQFSAQSRNFGGVNQNPFFTDPGVRQQLNLNDNQFNQLNGAYQNAYSRYSQGVAGLNNNQLTEEQRMQQMQQLRSRFNDEFNTNLDSTFTDPQLRQRYNQLNVQSQGPSAFNNADIQQQLNLTPAQQRQLRQLGVEWNRNLRRMRSSGRNASPDQWTLYQTQYQNQLNGILTPAQQQAYQILVGLPYSFPVNIFSG
jgi:hypothetical protein